MAAVTPSAAGVQTLVRLLKVFRATMLLILCVGIGGFFMLLGFMSTLSLLY